MEDFPQALAFFEQALEIDHKYGIQNQEGVSLGNVGNVYLDMGEFEKALQNHLEAVEIRYQLGDRYGIAAVLGSLGDDYLALNQPDTAETCFLNALQIDLELENRIAMVLQFEGLGRVYRQSGRLHNSLTAYDRALQLLANMEAPSKVELCRAGKAETENLIAAGNMPERGESAVLPSIPLPPEYVTNHPLNFQILLIKLDLWLATHNNP
jgi:tetratricopeptide (TPR) repeat protein